MSARPHAPEGPLGRPEPWFATALRVLVHAVTAGVVAFPLTVESGVAAAMIGAAAGSLAARFVARSSLRLPAIVAIGGVAMFAVLAVRWLLVDWMFVPSLLGPAGALAAGDAAVFGLGGLVVSTVLRALSARRPSFTILEAALVAGGFATLLVAHRNGAIHRPYELADPLIASGEDPALAVLLVGAGGALVVGLLLLSERSLLRSALHLGVVALLLLLILGTTAMTGLPTPPSTGGALGLQDDDRSASQRGGGGGGGGQGDGSGQRSSDQLDFMDDYPSGSPAPDAVVLFHDDYSPPGGYYYFRQNAFSQYNGHQLVAATRAATDVDVHNVFPTTRARDVAWTPPVGQSRTTVETTVAMLADNSAPLGLEAPERFVPATNPNPQRFRRLYRVHSITLTDEYFALMDMPAGDPSWDDATRQHYLQVPEDPRYAELAQRIVAGLPEDLAPLDVVRALAVTQYLSEHGTYSLRSRHASATDPTASFLFGDLTGYCVHFSHAAVYLMRAVGVPARVGTGYAVAEADRQGSSAILLRNSDQHAWPEVFVAGVGWVVFDVAPETVLTPGGDPPDPSLLQLLAEMARGSRPLDDAPQPPRPLSELARESGFALGFGALGLVGLALLLGYFLKFLRLLGASAPGAIYRRALDQLGMCGIRRAWGESPEAFARRLAREHAIASMRPLTNKHLGAAFGEHRGPDVLTAMLRDYARLRVELARTVPTWRRALGLLNPFSWILTR
ncbi:MAG: transglutaminase domain-containing protein [Sandaracinaceae bacterium]|nr:transglutaminase domain-containing protein [Sandaracinaceae bacterium]